VVQVQSVAWKVPHALGLAKKIKIKVNKTPNLNAIRDVEFLSMNCLFSSCANKPLLAAKPTAGVWLSVLQAHASLLSSHFFSEIHLFQTQWGVFFCLFLFLGPHLWHMEVPRLGVKSELLLPAYTTATTMWDLSHICDLHHSSWQYWLLNPLSEARD